MHRSFPLFPVILAVASTVSSLTLIFGLSAEKADATPSPLVISEDSVNGRVTVEGDTVKAVWHYKALPSENYNQGGGNLYELYYKPMDPSEGRNLVSFTNYGNPNSTTIWAGIGGVGGTDIYADDSAPGADQSNGFADLISDNNASGTVVSHSAYTDGQGDAVLNFVINVHNQSTGKDWYSVSKTWTVEPSGAIHEAETWTIINSGYFAEPALRSGWSYYVGWDRFSKYGRNWYDPNNATYLLGHDNIENETAQSWDILNAFHADWVAFTGSPIAPTVKMTADNNGQGFRGSGLYKLSVQVWGSGSQAIAEQCSELGGVTGAQEINWMAWWGGNPPEGNRYKWLSAGTSWSDSYRIDLFPGTPGGGPDISNVNAQNNGSGSEHISWTTDVASDSEVDILDPNGLRWPGNWNNSGADGSLTTGHAIQISGLQPGSSYIFEVKSRDANGNLAVSSDYQLSVPYAPSLDLAVNNQNVYWKSYQDYLNNLLSVDFIVKNQGIKPVNSVAIGSIAASSNVLATTAMPLFLGDINPGGEVKFTVAYQVPTGVDKFFTSLSGSGTGPNGESLDFPSKS